MRVFLIPVAAAALALSTLSAFAAETAISGEVKAVDMAAMTVTLTDGTVIKLPEGYADEDLVEGSDVTIEYTETDGNKVAATISFNE